MTVKRLISAFVATLTATLLLTTSSYASESSILTQAYMNEKSLDIFTDTDFEEETIEVKAANREADVIGCGSISDENISVCTTILVDTSTSIPPAIRKKVIEYINLSIKNLAAYEQLRIITFSEEINVLQDFTFDRYDLDKAAENIKFNGEGSAVYDAVYNTIPEIKLVNNKPCFYRTILVTDGVDYTDRGATKEELFLKLQALTYPLDIICVSAKQPEVRNKDLSALTRISNGRYYSLFSESNIEVLASDLSVKDYYWIRAEIPVVLLDGSTRQIDISDGTNNTSFDIKMSVVDAPVEEPPVQEPISSSSVEEQPTFSSSSSSLPAPVSDDDEGILFVGILPFIIIGVVVIAVGVTVAIILIKKKKSKALPIEPYPISTPPQSIELTEIIEEYEGKEHYSIKISNVSNQGDSWILDVYSDIIIGRAEICAVRIDDKSVSREQCKIAANKNGLVISNLSNSNQTKLNGTVLVTEVLLHPADNIHFGRVTLRVDYIQKVTDEMMPPSPPPLRDASSGSSGISKTKSIF